MFILFLLTALIVVAVGVAVVLMMGMTRPETVRARHARETGPAERRERPWWANPLFWLGVSAVSIVLGLFVWPQLFGGVFLFLPFIWVGGGTFSRRRRRDTAHSR